MSEIDRRAYPEGLRLWTWTAPDGWRYRRADWPQPGRAPRGSLLFAGGRGDFIEKYLEAAGHWHRAGWNVASFDWRGQGKSKGDIEGQDIPSFDPLLDDMAALVADWIAANPGPYVIVAHSLGAHMLLRLLIERSPPIAASVLIAPMIDVNSAPLSPRLARIAASAITAVGFGRRGLWKAPLATAPAGSRRQQVLTSCVERYEDEAYWWEQEPDFQPAAPTFGWLRAAYRSARIFTPANLKRIGLPILMLGAVEDRLVSAAAIRRAASFLPNAELEMYESSAHEILREADLVRRAALDRIDAFLDRHAA